jgi:hypothetical protein
MKKREIRKIAEYINDLRELLNSEELPSIDFKPVPQGMDHTSRQAHANAMTWKEKLAPLRKSYHEVDSKNQVPKETEAVPKLTIGKLTGEIEIKHDSNDFIQDKPNSPQSAVIQDSNAQSESKN